MKWVVYLLLLGNAAFFARQYHAMPEAPPPARPAPLPDNRVNRMLLLSEVASSELRTRAVVSDDGKADVPAPDHVASPTAVTERSCYSIGPLKRDAQIDSMRTWLVAMGGDPMLRIDERRELERYWVYFPPMASREEAVQRVKRMRAEGIEDIIVVPKGDMSNAISLGVFSQRSSVDRRLEELRTLGYEPSIMPRYRVEKASWFDVSFEEAEGLTLSEVSDRFPGVELAATRCRSGQIAGRGAGS